MTRSPIAITPRRRPVARRLTLVCIAATSMLLALCGSSAVAATGHSFLSSVHEAPTGTPLIEPAAEAVDRATGRLFVADSAAGVVDIFSAAGVFEGQFGEGVSASGLAIDEATGDVYVAEEFGDVVDVFKPSGGAAFELLSEWSGAATSEHEFVEVASVAFDNSTSVSDPSAGDLYVVDGEDDVVDVYKPKPSGPDEGSEGDLVRVLSAGKMEEPNGATVNDASGQLLVADAEKGAVYEFSSSGVLEAKLNGSSSPEGSFLGKEDEEGNVAAVAVDETSGDFLVAEPERHLVNEFNAAGVWVGSIGETPGGPLGEPFGVAVGPAGEVYVADSLLAEADTFAAGAVVPDVSTAKGTKLTRTTAVLNGTINGEGKTGKYFFQWGTTPALGSSTAPHPFAAGEQSITLTLGELHAGTTYFFRLAAENENGLNVGITREFTTPTAVEGLSTGPVQNLQPTSATLTGTLSPKGVDAHYFFEWGTTTAYGTKTPEPPADAGSPTTPVAATGELAGLTANTTYHYRIVATNSFGTSLGSDQKFTTSGPPRITAEAPTAIGHEEATVHASVNSDELASEYHFEYGESTAYGAEAPIGGAKLAAGEAAVPVSATLTEFAGAKLRLGVTYHYRVVATNSAGTTDEPDQTFTTVPPALIESENATGVSSDEATLHTQINPLGNDTTYLFQYGTEPCQANPAGCTDIPAPPGQDIGAGNVGVPESVTLSGLLPGTSYHYRVLATNVLGTSEGVEHTITTQSAPEPLPLADDRAWEMVTPPDKGAAAVEALTREGGVIRASEDGNRFTYVVGGALGEEVQGNRTPEREQILAQRTSSEWKSVDIQTPSTKAEGLEPSKTPEYQFFSPDLSSALVEPAATITRDAEPPLAPGVVQDTMYVRDTASGTYLPLVTEANTATGTQFGNEIHFVSATPDLSHVVISSRVPLAGPSSAAGLYEWSAGALQLVSVLPNGTPAKGLIEFGYSHTGANAISGDGSRVLWTTSEEEPHLGHLYMRDSAAGETVKLDAAQGVAEPPGLGAARFQTASADDSRVFFTDVRKLTPGASAEPGRPDLYECEMVLAAGKLTCALSDLTQDHNPGAANIQGVVFGVSNDGSGIYFVAKGALTPNENGNHETATTGKDNLYALHLDGSTWTTTFIATLANEDSPEWEANQVSNTAFLTAGTSPSGRYLAFMSAAPLTGYDNADANSGVPDEEVFLYDSAAASLRCVSCDASGARPLGVLDAENVGEGLGRLVDRRKVWVGHWLAGNIPGWTAENLASALIQSRYLSDDGRLFFNSSDNLVSQASNGKENVYEYEPSGLGTCTSASGGCVSLLSSGSSERESAFIEATPEGGNVFFVTAGQLLPQDTDTAYDIYDARECSAASPCLTTPATPPPGCESTAGCRPAEPALPAPVAPSGTATVSGPGNLAPPPAKQQVAGTKKTVTSTPTRAEKLAKALKSCRKKHRRKQRLACEKHARTLYRPSKPGKHPTTSAKPSQTASKAGAQR